MKALYAVAGLAGILLSILFGLYMGLWVCFIGGIVDVVEAFKATPIESLGVAIGIAKIFCASLIGWASFLVGIFFSSCFLIESSE